mgnify:CR=1 FL=1
MNLLTIEHLTKSYTERLLFDDTAFSINEGEKVGLIGINGTGKSTLLRIAAGLEEPDEGSVVKGRSLYIRYLPQIPEFQDGETVLEAIVRENENEPHFSSKEELKAAARSMLNRLEVPDCEAKIDTLSGGQRKRVALASVLLSTADLLILDEPTNHLDSGMAEWLEAYLKAFKGALLMITHDRYFLDSVTSRIVELDKGKLYSYQGGYEKYLELKAERIEMAEATERKRQSILRTEIAWMQRGARARSTKQKAHIQRYEALRDQEGPQYDRNVQLESIASRLGRTTVELKDISKSYGDKVLLKDFTYIFLKNDRVGIIGPNGSGKSTLMKIIAGWVQPDSGTTEIGQTVKLGYFSQENEAMDESLRVIDYIKNAAEYVKTKDGSISASQMLERFLFPSSVQYTVIGKLSGGEKRRLYLLRILMEAPNVILLDEPTNDLDIQTLVILEDYLDTFPGIVITVSHDRYFLDRVVTKVIELDNGTATVFSGNYSAYSDKKAMLRDAQIRAYLNQQQEIRHQEAVIAKLKSFNREKSIRRAESREKMLDKIERLEKPVEINDSMDIRLEPDVVSGNDVLTVTDLSKSFDTQTLFTHVSFEIKRGERIAVIGNNGTGKTTLLKIINGLIPADAGEIRLGAKVHIGYYDQEHQVLHMDKTLFQEIQDTYPNMNNTQIRNTLASFLFTGDDVFKLIKDLSGGERGRVSLAKLMLSDANFLLLDEPTNHLDITSKEILESALNRYTGTVLYVSHDRYFINRTATRILDLTGQSFVNYIGNYDYYLEKKEDVEAAFFAGRGSEAPKSALGRPADAGTGASSGTAASSSASDTGAKLDWKAQKEEQARIRKRQNELKKTEDAIHQLETRDSEINELLALEEVYTDVSRLMELNKEKDSISEKLEKLYELWEALAEE